MEHNVVNQLQSIMHSRGILHFTQDLSQAAIQAAEKLESINKNASHEYIVLAEHIREFKLSPFVRLFKF